ncbi:MAG: 16S rRNA (cytosine(967)-C(5))-methyltransferase RsmB [Anaerovoracaceae bacterium]|jgi:16S rRNA (cytosine967-C5)-methyltransferase
MDPNREAAFRVLLRIERDSAYSNIELNRITSGEGSLNEAFVRELVYSVLRNRKYLDYMLRQLVAKGYDRLQPEVKTILRMGASQIGFFGSVPDYAAVSEQAALCRTAAPGRTGFVNAVLRNYIRKKDKLKKPEQEKDPVTRLLNQYSCERWIVKKWIRMFGEERAESLLAAGNRTPELCVSVNTLKIGSEELMERLTREGFRCRREGDALFVRGSGLIEGEAFREGLFFVQDQSSILATEALGAQPGERIIDPCAAPGGKSFQLALRMKDQGTIFSMDLYEHRMELLRKEAERLGITMIETKVRDAEDPIPELAGTADRVICDVPCSGLGVIRRKPEIKYRKLPDGGCALAETQLRILLSSSSYVRPGGVLMYSTCTINDMENEGVAERFLEKNAGFRKLAERQLLPDTDGCDGFYYCVMKKEG